MTVRTAAAVAALASLAVGAPAFAATKPRPKPACLLVTDATGDGTTMGAVPNRAALDIVSADVASGARNLVAVVRVSSLTSDPTLSTGVSYALSWAAGGVTQVVTTQQYTDGRVVSTFDPNTEFAASGDESAVPVAFDAATSTITWTIPRKANPVLAKRGAKFGSFKATATQNVNLAPPGGVVDFTTSISALSGDEAQSGKTYTDLMPSCVKGV